MRCWGRAEWQTADRSRLSVVVSVLGAFSVLLLIMIFVFQLVIMGMLEEEDDDSTAATPGMDGRNGSAGAPGSPGPAGPAAPGAVPLPLVWSYAQHGDVPGPNKWKDDHAACAGTSQSPIDLPEYHAALLRKGSSLGSELRMVGGLCDNFHGEMNDHTWEVAGLNECPNNATITFTPEAEVSPHAARAALISAALRRRVPSAKCCACWRAQGGSCLGDSTCETNPWAQWLG